MADRLDSNSSMVVMRILRDYAVYESIGEMKLQNRGAESAVICENFPPQNIVPQAKFPQN